MNNDLGFEWEAFLPLRLHLFSPTGARSVASMVAMSVLGLHLVVSAIIFTGSLTNSGRFFGYAKQYCIRAISLSLVIGAAVYLTLPKLPASQVQAYRRVGAHTERMSLPYAIDQVFEEKPDLRHSNESVIAAAVIDSMARWRFPTNLLTGSAYEMQSTPGNFTVRKEAGKVIFELYDEIGSPLRFEPENLIPVSHS